MEFNDKMDLLLKLRTLKELGYGSQGIVYYEPNMKKAIKIYHEAMDDYLYNHITFNITNDKIKKLNSVYTKTYVFPKELIYVEGVASGYIMDYVKGTLLNKVNPLKIDLNKFIRYVSVHIKDTNALSKNGVNIYDVTYNTMLTEKGLKIIDTDLFTITGCDNKILLKRNTKVINFGIMSFFVEGLFNEFVSSDILLNEMYKLQECNTVEFLKLFKKKISEYIGEDVRYLSEAFPLINKKQYRSNYVR